MNEEKREDLVADSPAPAEEMSLDAEAEGQVSKEGAQEADFQETGSDERATDALLSPEDVQKMAEKLADMEAVLEEAEGKLEEAEEKAAEYLDGWQRTQASFANYRKRTEGEQKHWRSAANAQILSRILPVIDDFKRAFESMPEHVEEDPWLSGIRLIRRKLESILESENVKPIEIASGDSFDPKYHEAILVQEVEGFDEDQIVAEVETGYMLGDRVLRPTKVVVAKASDPVPEAPAETTEKRQEESADESGDIAEEVVEVAGEVVEPSQPPEAELTEDEETSAA
jgi:molecular chaperone GrpE